MHVNTVLSALSIFCPVPEYCRVKEPYFMKEVLLKSSKAHQTLLLSHKAGCEKVLLLISPKAGEAKSLDFK